MKSHRGMQWGAVEEFGTLMLEYEHPAKSDPYDAFLHEDQPESHDVPLGEFVADGAAAYAERAQLNRVEMHDATVSVARVVGAALVKARVQPNTDLFRPMYDALPAKARPKLASGSLLDTPGENFVMQRLGVWAETDLGQTKLLLEHSRVASRAGSLLTIGVLENGVQAEGIAIRHGFDDAADCQLLCVDTLARLRPTSSTEWRHRKRDGAAHVEQGVAARVWQALSELMESRKLTSEAILRQMPR